MRAKLFVAILLIGCGSAVAPLTGDIYVLESVSGSRLPAPYSEITNNRIHADTIAFGSGGNGVRRALYDSYQGTKRLDQTLFTYTRIGDRVEISFECPGPAPCLAPPHLAGTFGSSGLTITESKITLVPLVFRRLFPPD